MVQISCSADTGSVNHCPSWVFSFGSAAFYTVHLDSNGAARKFPIVWRDPVKSRIKALIRELGDRFDGDERIEFVRTGGWQTGTNEPSVNDARDFSDFETVLGALGIPMNTGHGETALDGTDEYSVAIVGDGGFLDTYAASFPDTALAVTIKFVQGNDPDNDFYQALNDKCVALGVEMLNTGLNDGDKATSRTTAATWKAAGAKFGWGGTTSGNSSLSATSKQIRVAEEAVGANGKTPSGVTSHIVLKQSTANTNMLAYPTALGIVLAGLVP